MNSSSNEANNNLEINDLESNCADEIKGGPKKIFIGGLSAQETQTVMADLEPIGEIKGGLPAVQACRESARNHNETVAADENLDDSAETARLTDLPVNSQQEDEIKGGPGSGAGGVWLNHNETLTTDEATDDSAETARLADLPVNNRQEDEVKGGLLLPAVQTVREAAAR